MPVGKFITFEGGEGGGKSTQVELLCAALIKHGIDVRATREPGGTAGAEEIRNLLVSGAPGRWLPATEALLHSAARHEHVSNLIRPNLESGQWVISDRFADSTIAYQGYAQALGRNCIEQLTRFAIGEIKPDLTLILDLPPEIGLERAKARGQGGASPAEDRYEQMGAEFHQALRDGFLEIAKREPGRCTVIDASAPKVLVAAAIWKTVCERLELKI